jgi:hypothetical protein
VRVRDDVSRFVYDKTAADRERRPARKLTPKKIHYIVGIARRGLAFGSGFGYFSLRVDAYDRGFDLLGDPGE